MTRPIIDSCDNMPHFGDRQRWRPVSKQVLPCRSRSSMALIDPHPTWNAIVRERITFARFARAAAPIGDAVKYRRPG
jgi:hypothetical protein